MPTSSVAMIIYNNKKNHHYSINIMAIIIKNNYGRTIIKGGTISITDGKTFVDGKPIDELNAINTDDKVINITIEGNVERLEVDYCTSIKVTGDAKRIKTSNGDIEIGGNVSGDVHTNMGSITCGDIEGDCHTNMGSIYMK